MRRKSVFVLTVLLGAARFALPAQEHDMGYYPEVLHGEVWIEMEPVYGIMVDEEYPLDGKAAAKRALEESALFYSAMIYGWSFHYDIGEKARRTPEKLELVPVASIPFGDPLLKITQAEMRDMRVRLWTDYHLSAAQQRRMRVWRTGTIRGAQATGFGPLGGPVEVSGWLEIKKAALEDAARSALRGALRGSERNRPKEVTGFICLASFPRYFIDSGRWAAAARFRFEVSEIIPFAAY